MDFYSIFNELVQSCVLDAHIGSRPIIDQSTWSELSFRWLQGRSGVKPPSRQRSTRTHKLKLTATLRSTRQDTTLRLYLWTSCAAGTAHLIGRILPSLSSYQPGRPQMTVTKSPRRIHWFCNFSSLAATSAVPSRSASASTWHTILCRFRQTTALIKANSPS